MNLDKIRRDTRGCSTGDIFLSSAGSSLQPDCVIDVISEYQELERVKGGYFAADAFRERIDRVYETIARHLSCAPEEIALVENATRAWQSVFLSIPFAEGDSIITTQSEYHSNYIPLLQAKKKHGINIKVVPHNELGEVCLDSMRALMDETVKLITLTHIPSNNGLVNDAAAVGAIAKEYGALFLLDACQSAGQMRLDVSAIGCDFLVASGRKFLRGPRGTGFLYARQSSHRALEPAILDGLAAEWLTPEEYAIRSDARKFETWEKNYALFLGLGQAVEYADSIGMDAIEARISDLASYTRTQLHILPDVSVCDTGSKMCGIVTFKIDGVEACQGYSVFKQMNVHLGYTGVRSTRLDMEARKLDCVFRASVHYFNSRDEIDSFVAVVEKIVADSTSDSSGLCTKMSLRSDVTSNQDKSTCVSA